jgi:hypothetical protein
LADRIEMVIAFEPTESVADKAKDRIGPIGPDTEYHQARKHLLVDRKRDHARIKMPERHSPFLCQSVQRTFIIIIEL